MSAAMPLGVLQEPVGVPWASVSSPFINSSLHNDTSYSNCSNDYCIPDEDYVALIETYVFPTPYEWILIAMHAAVFCVGLVGNALVCAAVYRNPGMRTVTNYFLVNLAVADFLIILLCLPPTVVWDVTETWFLGPALCKVVLYFQTVSVTVSVLTLTFISVDRWYAICFPLKFKSTTSRAKRAIALIWVVALLFDLPELIVLDTQKKELRVDSMLLTQCVPSWDRQSDMAFHSVKTAVLYTLPLAFMSLAYCQIARVLWNEEHFPVHHSTTSYGCAPSRGRAYLGSPGGIPGGLAVPRGPAPGPGGRVLTTVSTRRPWPAEGQIRSRRKAAKMLFAVVAMFAICYLPVHLLSILRYTMDIPQTEITNTLSLLSHWLCYANSALNPLIYNFMSGKFRKEFRRTFGCRCWRRAVSRGWSLRGRGAGNADGGGLVAMERGLASAFNVPDTGNGRTVIVQLGRNSQVEVVPLTALNGVGRSVCDLD